MKNTGEYCSRRKRKIPIDEAKKAGAMMLFGENMVIR